MLVDNRPGAGGNIAHQYLATSAPADGSVILLGSVGPLTVASSIIDASGGVSLITTANGGDDDHLSLSAPVIVFGGAGNNTASYSTAAGWLTSLGVAALQSPARHEKWDAQLSLKFGHARVLDADWAWQSAYTHYAYPGSERLKR